MSLERLSRRMSRRATNLDREVNKVKRLAALAIDQAVVLATPVDTGRARSNWLVSLGDARDDEIEPYDNARSGATYLGSDPSRFNETANANAAIEQAKGVIAKSRIGVPIHITNNVPYIQKLNEGHSVQAPVQFVEKAIQDGVLAVKRARIDTGK